MSRLTTAIVLLTLMTGCEEAPPIEGPPVVAPFVNPVTVPPEAVGEDAYKPGEKPEPVIAEEPPVDPGWRPPLVKGDTPPELKKLGLTSNQLVALGKRYHASKRWEPASKLFIEATRRSQKNAEAHYMLARSKARQRKAEGACAHGAHLSTVLQHLELAVSLNKSFRKKMSKQSDLADVHGTVWFKAIQGANVKDAATTQRLATESIWYEKRSGGAANATRLQQGGTLTRRVSSSRGVGLFETLPGQWSSGAGTVELSLAGAPATTYTMTRKGDLTLDGSAAYSNLPSECGS